MATKATLYMLPGAWGLPTFHPDFLKVWTYLKLAGPNFEDANFPPSLDAPKLTIEDHTICGSDEIIEHLRSKAHDLDTALVRMEERAESFAFISMIEGQLLSALYYDWFMVDDNYHSQILPLYSSAVTFPESWYLPWNVSRKMKARLGHPTPEEGEVLYKQADAILQALHQRLGDKSFFYGDEPTILDVVFYGHVAPMLYARMPPPCKLSSAVQNYPNLVKLIQSINERTSVIGDSVPAVGDGATGSKTEEGMEGKSKKVLTAKEKARRRRARDFIAAGVILTVGFVLLNTVFEVDAGDAD